MKLKIVEVWWMDAYTKGGWFEYNKKGHHKDAKLMPATGLEVDHDDEWLVLAHSYNPDANEFVGDFSIPAPLIKRKRVLKIVEV